MKTDSIKNKIAFKEYSLKGLLFLDHSYSTR